MAKKEKKPLTAKQQRIKYKAFSFACVGGEFAALFTPFVIMGIVNFNDWFIQSDAGWKVGLGASLAMALVGIAAFLVGRKKENETKVTNGWITMIVGWYMVAFIFVLLTDILDQIAMIMLIGGTGLAGAMGFDFGSKKCENISNNYKIAIQKANQDKLDEQAKEELNQKENSKDVKF